MSSNSDASTPHPSSLNLPHWPSKKHGLLTINVGLLGQVKLALESLVVSGHLNTILLTNTSSGTQLGVGSDPTVWIKLM